MTRNFISRIVAMAVMGILLGLYAHHDFVRWNARGRDAFLAYQSMRFERYMANPRPIVLMVLSSIIGVFFFCIYEIIALAISALLKSSMPDPPPINRFDNYLGRTGRDQSSLTIPKRRSCDENLSPQPQAS